MEIAVIGAFRQIRRDKTQDWLRAVSWFPSIKCAFKRTLNISKSISIRSNQYGCRKRCLCIKSGKNILYRISIFKICFAPRKGLRPSFPQSCVLQEKKARRKIWDKYGGARNREDLF